MEDIPAVISLLGDVETMGITSDGLTFAVSEDNGLNYAYIIHLPANAVNGQLITEEVLSQAALFIESKHAPLAFVSPPTPEVTPVLVSNASLLGEEVGGGTPTLVEACPSTSSATAVTTEPEDPLIPHPLEIPCVQSEVDEIPVDEDKKSIVDSILEYHNQQSITEITNGFSDTLLPTGVTSDISNENELDIKVLSCLEDTIDQVTSNLDPIFEIKNEPTSPTLKEPDLNLEGVHIPDNNDNFAVNDSINFVEFPDIKLEPDTLGRIEDEITENVIVPSAEPIVNPSEVIIKNSFDLVDNSLHNCPTNISFILPTTNETPKPKRTYVASYNRMNNLNTSNINQGDINFPSSSTFFRNSNIVLPQRKPLRTYGKAAKIQKQEQQEEGRSQPNYSQSTSSQSYFPNPTASNPFCDNDVLSLGQVFVKQSDKVFLDRVRASRASSTKPFKKRRVIIDVQKQIPIPQFKNQLQNTKDITVPPRTDLAPATKPAMRCMEFGGVARFFSSPGRNILSTPLSRLFTNHLVMAAESGPSNLAEILPLSADLRIPSRDSQDTSSAEFSLEGNYNLNPKRLVNIGKPLGCSIESMFKGLNRPPVFKEYKRVKRKPPSATVTCTRKLTLPASPKKQTAGLMPVTMPCSLEETLVAVEHTPESCQILNDDAGKNDDFVDVMYAVENAESLLFKNHDNSSTSQLLLSDIFEDPQDSHSNGIVLLTSINGIDLDDVIDVKPETVPDVKPTNCHDMAISNPEVQFSTSSDPNLVLMGTNSESFDLQEVDLKLWSTNS